MRFIFAAVLSLASSTGRADRARFYAGLRHTGQLSTRLVGSDGMHGSGDRSDPFPRDAREERELNREFISRAHFWTWIYGVVGLEIGRLTLEAHGTIPIAGDATSNRVFGVGAGWRLLDGLGGAGGPFVTVARDVVRTGDYGGDEPYAGFWLTGWSLSIGYRHTWRRDRVFVPFMEASYGVLYAEEWGSDTYEMGGGGFGRGPVVGLLRLSVGFALSANVAK